jgi:uncharacterized protein (TIGR00297 family)
MELLQLLSAHVILIRTGGAVNKNWNIPKSCFSATGDVLYNKYMKISVMQLVTGIGFSAIIGIIAYRLKVLNISGTIGALIIGTIIFGLGGLIFAVPLLFFFITGSLLSRLKNESKRRSLKLLAKPGPRSIGQVFANGGPAIIFAIAYSVKGNPIWFIGYLASLCESAADTWATEIGTLSQSAPVSIITLKPMPAGQSGAISFWGTITSVGGAFLTMAITFITARTFESLPSWPIQMWLAAAYAGVMGSLIDSVLGGTVQASYKCAICGKTIEQKTHCGKLASKIRGFGFINNDVVSFISSFLAAILALWLVM